MYVFSYYESVKKRECLIIIDTVYTAHPVCPSIERVKERGRLVGNLDMHPLISTPHPHTTLTLYTHTLTHSRTRAYILVAPNCTTG